MDLKQYIAEKRGRATDLANFLGVSLSYLSQMASGSAPIASDRAVLIEQGTEGAVTRKDLYKNDWDKHWPELKDKRRKSHVTQS
jgi:DNA-binding transcriptional regulator YdaS (Cro superfamily)